MQANRIFVEKRPQLNVEAESLRKELNGNLGLNITELRLINIYDLFGFSNELLEKCRYGVFGETVTDKVSDKIDYTALPHLAWECLPGQFDQRAASAEECVRLIQPDAEISIRSGRLLIFNPEITNDELSKIAHYMVNTVESRVKDLDRLAPPEMATATPVETLVGFREITAENAPAFCREKGLAMNGDDLMEIVKYFIEEGRDPNETELRILDTYWSDHCRHTTFTTTLTDIAVDDSFVSEEINRSLEEWHNIRRELGRENKNLCLMDLATVGARYLKSKGLLDDLEQSEENNACSIYVDVDVDGETERWLLQFKNETHNHPTEIEPFGGASTCLGGAIRDPLSGRSYVYQAMRVTGAGDILQPVADTLPGKLPQRVISTRAAAGYSSYGNQIGLATTHVREIFHPGYTAKRMEVGAVVGAVKAADVRRESPAPGDVVIMFGGRTGRDGIGGATGSSKEHTEESLETCGSEVQKGNAPEERKIERLFRRPEVTRLIKKSNDFGAGGVSVAIGELADSLDIYLDRVKTKYSGLNVTELAISESQERMSVVVERKDMEEFMKYCAEENLEATHVADITDTGRMRLLFDNKEVASLKREFIDSAGAPHFATARITAISTDSPFDTLPEGENIADKMQTILENLNVSSQKGLIEMFDSSIGASTVLMPFGGKTQSTEAQVSVQRLPVGNHHTDTASMMSFGFNPFISSWSPYHGAAYAVVESVAKNVAAGSDFSRMRFSYQEYFEKMTSPEAWGKPLSALLGALRMQTELGLPSIGGKDSMSGTFGNISVPPTLIAFGISPVESSMVISPEFKDGGHYVYLVRHTPLESRMPDTDNLKRLYKEVRKQIEKHNIVAGFACGFGGVSEALAKMSFGNEIGAEINNLSEKDLFGGHIGSIVIEAKEEINCPGFELIGKTTSSPILSINGEEMTISQLKEWNSRTISEVYPEKSGVEGEVADATSKPYTGGFAEVQTDHPVVYLPLFPGTNCDYDMERAFTFAGATVVSSVFRNLNARMIEESVAEMARNIDNCHILAFSGGFSAGDEPDGSGKFIASVLRNEIIKAAVERLLARGGLILGICNGFQALVKSGLLPFGKIGEVTPDSPTLFRNDINRHISQMVTTRVASVDSPWLCGFEPGELHTIAASHGEGKFTCSKEVAEQLAREGRIAFQYADPNGHATMESPYNPNGSTFAIEGIISPCGRILGKMGHSERYHEGLMKNIPGNRRQNIFLNAVNYFKGKK